MAVPVLKNILRQHAEQAAFLWTVYDHALLHPDAEDNDEMDEERIARVVEQLEAHLDGLRVAGAEGLAMAEEVYAEYPEAGELFVKQILSSKEKQLRIKDFNLKKIRTFLSGNVG